MVKGRSCVKLSRNVKHPTRCTRYVKVGRFTHSDRAGAIKFKFTGRLGRHALAVAPYELSAVARSGRLHSKTVTVRFRVIR